MTLYFTAEEQVEYEKNLRTVYFKSSFGFANAHNGLRPGSMLLVQGTAGGGKTTYTRSLIRDLLVNNPDVHIGIWLSEETVSDYKAQLAQGLPHTKSLLQTEAFSEQEQLNPTELQFFEWLEFYKSDVVIFDNITTSRYYVDKKPQEQAQFVTKLKATVKKLNTAMIIIAHTDASVNDSQKGLINLNQIRGSKTICNLVEFAYILQRFQTGDSFYPTLRIVKSRSQDVIHSLYFLKYEPRLRSYISDKALNFQEFKDAYGKRNRLE